MDVLIGTGADASTARLLAEATVEAELVGNRAVGVSHLFDYLDGYQHGRIARDAVPQVRHAAPAVIDVDSQHGTAQAAFAAAADDLYAAIRRCGLAAVWIKNSFTCGELGYYPRRVAHAGYIGVATANSPALMSLGGAPRSVLGTNPLAFAIPRPGLPPLVIDQASSSTAFVNIRRAAEADQPIPPGWALGPDGHPTQDPTEALNGTLLPFGSHRGGNIALLVEILSALSGSSFSLDAAPFQHGTASPSIGVFVLGIDPDLFPGSLQRLNDHLTTLRDSHQVKLPALDLTVLPAAIELPDKLIRQLEAAALEPTERRPWRSGEPSTR